MSWVEVYNAASESVVGDMVAHLAAVPILILFAWYEHRRGGSMAAGPLVIAVAFLAVSGLIVMRRSRAVASASDCQWVEGPVHLESAERFGGHGPSENIVVGDTRIRFSYFTAEVGYRQTIARGGALQEGREARICLSEGRMMRVQIRENEVDGP